jgi:N-acetylmuramoyl-L-alanine amidase
MRTSIYLLALCLLFIGTVSGQSDSREVVAERGDGIHTLLARYGLDSAYHVQQFIALNSERLGENRWLYAGRRYLLPADPRTSASESASTAPAASNPPTSVTIDLFGLKYAITPIIDNSLQGAVFYIVAGHGGPDPGAEGTRDDHKMCEDEYNYDVALRLCRELIMRGAVAYMIVRDSTDGIRDEAYLVCDTDEYCIGDLTIPRNHLARLQQRAEAINRLYRENSQSKYQRKIELHIDSRGTGQRVDVYFYHHSKSRYGKRLADNIHSHFGVMYQKHQPERGYTGSVTPRDGLYMISRTIPPAVYIELGNIQNHADQLRFIRWENRQALAKWIAEGIVTDYKAHR